MPEVDGLGGKGKLDPLCIEPFLYPQIQLLKDGREFLPLGGLADPDDV